jgi:DivIVA domain-containing protein
MSTPESVPPPGPPSFDPDPTPIESIRAANFAIGLRGYDRDQVDAFLARLADQLERAPAAPPAESDVDDSGALRQELERIGERTKQILTAAEETAQELRSEAASKAQETRSAAEKWANRVRGDAEEFADSTRAQVNEEARLARAEASRKADELVTGAEQRADEVLQDTANRRRLLETRIESLVERRDAILADARALVDELSTALAAHAPEATGLGPPPGAEGEEDDDRPLSEGLDAGLPADPFADEEPIAAAALDEDDDLEDDELTDDDLEDDELTGDDLDEDELDADELEAEDAEALEDSTADDEDGTSEYEAR